MPLALDHRLLVVVGPGGVGKTTLAAAIGLTAARHGADTLVMTFDPARRLRDALGIGEQGGREVLVPLDAPGALAASLLDSRATFDALIRRYAPDRAAADRIFANRFYDQLAGSLAGILEYMAVERLFEVAAEGRWQRVVLDTPPTRQALDFLDAPERMTGFLGSGAVKLALKPWFDRRGRLRVSGTALDRPLARLLDRLVGLALLRDMAEFFQAFAPLYDGFAERASAVRELLRSPDTAFVLVAHPAAERLADTMFFARQLTERGHRVAAVVANQVHPTVSAPREDLPPGLQLLGQLGDRDSAGVARLRSLLPGLPVVALPLLPEPPAGLRGLSAFGGTLVERLEAARDSAVR